MTQKSPPHGSRWGFGKELGAGDGWEGVYFQVLVGTCLGAAVRLEA